MKVRVERNIAVQTVPASGGLTEGQPVRVEVSASRPRDATMPFQKRSQRKSCAGNTTQLHNKGPFPFFVPATSWTDDERPCFVCTFLTPVVGLRAGAGRGWAQGWVGKVTESRFYRNSTPIQSRTTFAARFDLFSNEAATERLTTVSAVPELPRLTLLSLGTAAIE